MKANQSNQNTSIFYFSGRRAGQAIVDHHDVRKVGFTGSTPVGADIMKR